MLRRSIQIRVGLEGVVGMDRKLWHLSLTDEEWEKVSEVLELLEPFAQVTNDMEADTYPTLCAVVPLYNALINHLIGWIGEDDSEPTSPMESSPSASPTEPPIVNDDDDEAEHSTDGMAKPKHSTESIAAARAALEKMVQYYKKTSPTYIINVILDPRLKMDYFKKHPEWKDLVDSMLMPLYVLKLILFF